MARGRIRIGTSGWHYRDWWGRFYPDDLPARRALDFYRDRFDAVELNAPFYRTPTPEAVVRWRETVPADFRYAWKASRFLTHFKRLLVDDESIALLEARVDLLGPVAGPVLFQLPPHMKVNRERLAGFVTRLPGHRQYAFEFRDPGWYQPAVYAVLRDHDMALCLSDHASAPAPVEVTASWVYVRNHGPGGRYHGSYSDEALAQWASVMSDWRSAGLDVWCFFDNDVKSAAPADAERLLGAVSRAARTA